MMTKWHKDSVRQKWTDQHGGTTQVSQLFLPLQLEIMNLWNLKLLSHWQALVLCYGEEQQKIIQGNTCV